MGQGSGAATSCGVACRFGSESALLWLRCRLAAAALVQPLAQELPYAAGMAVKKKKKKKAMEQSGQKLRLESWIAWRYITPPPHTSYVNLGASVCLSLFFLDVIIVQDHKVFMSSMS